MDLSTPKRRSGKRPVKRKFHGNRFSTRISGDHVEPTTASKPVSASRRKIQNQTYCETACTSNVSYRLIDLSVFIKELKELLCCSNCHGHVEIVEKSVYGLSSVFEVQCSCDNVNVVRTTNMIGKQRNIPDVNRRAVLAMRLIGKGATHLQKFCNVMCLPQPISQKSYEKVNCRIQKATAVVASQSMKSAAEEEAELTGSTDIAISGDGTWKTRGHSSLVGVCTVIGLETGKVIDTEVMSSYCKGCDVYKGKKSGRAYNKWLTQHTKFCAKNHSGSAGKMEVDGMVRIFRRSSAESGVRYTSYIGDGDSKTFLSICESQPYGLSTPLEKIECVGHIQKRMGTRLRKLKKNMQSKKLSDGKTIGGRGRLTDQNIQKLTVYYGNAIRGNKNSVYEMRKNIWAIWCHSASTDEVPQHYFCPKGDNSWCKYNKAVVNKTVTNYKHSNPIPIAVMNVIKPIFKDLSDPKLLKRCLGGRTQNPNESLNALIWSVCPKTSNSSRKIAEIAVNISTITFNEGNSGLLKVMQELELNVNSNFVKNVQECDEQRVKVGDKRASEATQEARKAKKMKKTVQLQKFLEEEGVTYAAGEFGCP